MHVWNVLHAARWKYGTQKSPKIRDISTITQVCRAISLQLRHASTIGKNMLNSNISPSHNMVNFGPLVAAIGSGVWGTPANFNGFRVLASLLQRRRSPETNQTLHDIWPFPGLVYTIYTFSGALAPQRNLARCKIHFASKSCALLLAALLHGGLSQTLRCWA